MNIREHKGEVSVAEPTDLEIRGLKEVFREVIKRYTAYNLEELEYRVRDNQFQNKFWEIELEKSIEAGFLEQEQRLEGIFLHDTLRLEDKVLLKIYNIAEDEYEFMEVVL